MKRLILLVLLVPISVFVQGEHPKIEECKKSSEKFFKKSHKNGMECHADVKDDKLSSLEQFEKIGCTLKCLLKKDKMLDTNDTITEEFLKNNYKGFVIEEFEEKLLKLFDECRLKFKLDKNDEKCKSYGQYGLCMQEAVSHVCYENP